jgi:hypothetical protein
MYIRKLKAVTIVALMLFTFPAAATWNGLGKAAAPTEFAQAQKKREDSYAEKIFDSPLYSGWLAKSEINGGSNTCMTNYSSFHVDMSKSRPVEPRPTNMIDHMYFTKGSKASARFKYDKVVSVSKKHPEVKAYLDSLTANGKKEINPMDMDSLFNSAIKYLTLKEFVEVQQYEVRQKQADELAWSGGVKTSEWVGLEGRYQLVALEAEESYIFKTVSQGKEYNDKLEENKPKKLAIEQATMEEMQKARDSNRMLSGHGFESSAYLDVQLIHKVQGIDTPIVPIANGVIETEYQKQLLSLVDMIGKKCKETNYIVLNHHFENVILGKGSVAQTMYVREGRQWEQKFVENEYAGVMSKFDPEKLTAKYWMGKMSATWDRREYHPLYNAYEVSLMADDSNEIAVPAIVRTPTNDDIRMVVLREHARAGATVDYVNNTIEVGFYDGSTISQLEKIEVKSCTPVGSAFNCTFHSVVKTNIGGGNLATVTAALMKEVTGSETELTSKIFTYDIEMTSKGWRSTKIAANIQDNVEKSKQRAGEALKSGLRSGSCAVAQLGPDELIPSECQ